MLSNRIKKFIKRWVLPPGFIELRPSAPIRKLNSLSDSRALSSLKDSQSGRCFILASGPSILNQNLKMLEGESVIALSHSHRHPDIRIINPRFHVLAPFHAPFTFSDCEKYFNDFDLFYKNVNIFIGHRPYTYSFKNYLSQNSEHKQNNNFHYIDYTNSSQLVEGSHLSESVWDFRSAPFEVRTVVYSGIQLAYFLGYKQIYLLGCDHDYLYTQARKNGNRFYSDKDGIDDTAHLSVFDSERWYLEYYMRWKQYRLMREFLKSKNVEIFNATDGGYLDVFPRAKFDDLF
jgi:hypothetical protein